MLLVGKEHVMKIPELHMSCMLFFVGIILILLALCADKNMKAHIIAYTMFP